MARWSAAHDWVHRAAAWDAAQLPALDAEVAERHRNATLQRLDAADRLRALALAALADVDPGKVRPADAVRMLEAADRLEGAALTGYVPSAERDRTAEHNAPSETALAALLDDLINATAG